MSPKQSESRMFTFQTRLKVDLEQDGILSAYAELMGKIERTLFADIAKGKNPSELKTSYLKLYQITARQFNALRVKVEGKIASLIEIKKNHVSELKLRLDSLEKKIVVLDKKKSRKALELHQKKRRLHRLQAKFVTMKQEMKEGKVSLAFGSNKLFRAQFNLKANNYTSHEEWKQTWKEAFSGACSTETGDEKSILRPALLACCDS